MDREHFFVTDSDGNEVKAYIKAAPEPEDIIWMNLGQDKWELRKKKIKTFLITVIVLGISFLIIYGLSSAQVSYSQDSSNSYISFLISLIISIINIIIQRNSDHI